MSGTSDQASARRRILIVDDEREIRAVLEEFLVARGYAVSAVETGREALDATAAPGAAFAAALVDWTLPGIGGPDVMAQIRQAHPACHIYAMTGHADQYLSSTAAKDLVEEVFRKPFSLRALVSRLDRDLGSRAEDRA